LFAQFLRLPLSCKWIFIKAVALAFLIRMSLRVVKYGSIVRILMKFKAGEKSPETPELKMYRSLIILSYRFPGWFINCLSIGTAFWFLMKRKGIKTELRFGMRKEHDKLHAHAWLEVKGTPLTLDRNIKEKYSAFPDPIL
jgi:hypothetical protein